MAPVSTPSLAPADPQNGNMQSIHATLQQFHEQSPQLFWLVVCVFSFSFGLTAICTCYKIGMILWKGPNYNVDPRLIPPPRKLKKAYPPRLTSRSNSTLARSGTGTWKQQLLDDDRKLFVAPYQERKLPTMSRRSWTQSLLAHASLLRRRDSGAETWLGNHLEQCKAEAPDGLASLPVLLSEKEAITPPASCYVKGAGVACAPAGKIEAGLDDKRASLTSEASAYSQASAPCSPDSSVPSIIVQPCDSPSHRAPVSPTSPLVLTPDSPSPPRPGFESMAGETGEQPELLRVPPSPARPRPRKPSFASSRGTSHVTGRRFALAAPPPRRSSRKAPPKIAENGTTSADASPECKVPERGVTGYKASPGTTGVGRGRGKENSTPGYGKAPMGSPRGLVKDQGFQAPRVPFATRMQGATTETAPWMF